MTRLSWIRLTTNHLRQRRTAPDRCRPQRRHSQLKLPHLHHLAQLGTQVALAWKLAKATVVDLLLHLQQQTGTVRESGHVHTIAGATTSTSK
jgi:hypothetical protein